MKDTKLRVLIIDDERNLRESLAELVASEGFAIEQAADGEAGLAAMRASEPDLVFLDLRMPKLDGLGVLKTIKQDGITAAPVVVISAFGDSGKMIEAMRLGAYDYVTKPVELDELVSILHRAADQSRANRNVSTGTDGRLFAEPGEEPELLGNSRIMRDVFKRIGRVAASDATVLITGESGTGKELVARAIHRHSARAKNPFIAVNCGALPEQLIESELFGHERGAFTGADKRKPGRFELAQTGTLFLDEVGELTAGAQVKLLRALQERQFERVGGTVAVKIDVRVIAATNRDLKEEVDAGRFREDLFYRLRVIDIQLPPLRERMTDLPLLTEYFLERIAARDAEPVKAIAPEALAALMRHEFPGNVRELQNVIERSVVAAGSSAKQLSPEHFTEDLAAGGEARGPRRSRFLELPLKEAVGALEKELIQNALDAAGGNRTEAARRLGINRRLLYSKMEEHGLS